MATTGKYQIMNVRVSKLILGLSHDITIKLNKICHRNGFCVFNTVAIVFIEPGGIGFLFGNEKEFFFFLVIE